LTADDPAGVSATLGHRATVGGVLVAEHMQYITTAERIGIQKGRKECRQEGEVAMLLRLIARKFGPPTEPVRERIERADPETLVEWSDRILTAQTLAEVLDDAS